MPVESYGKLTSALETREKLAEVTRGVYIAGVNGSTHCWRSSLSVLSWRILKYLCRLDEALLGSSCALALIISQLKSESRGSYLCRHVKYLEENKFSHGDAGS